MMLGTLFYVLANFFSAVLIACMLQTTFLKSGPVFRWLLSLFAASLLGCAFYGLGALTAIGRVEVVELGVIAFVELMRSLLLLAVLMMMRLKQIREGRGDHPRARGLMCVPVAGVKSCAADKAYS